MKKTTIINLIVMAILFVSVALYAYMSLKGLKLYK